MRLTLAILLVLTIPATSVLAGDVPSWRALKAEFAKSFRKRDEYTRCRALLNLVRIEYPEAAELVPKIVDEHESPAILAYGAWALSRLIEPDSHDRMREAYPKRDTPGRAAILLGLRMRGDPGSNALRTAALAEKDVVLRAAAVTAVGARKRSGQKAALVAALADPAWQVRAAALERIVARGLADAAVGLLPILEDPSMRLRFEAGAALRELTGKDFGLDRELWRNWLESGKEASREPGASVAPTFYGIRVIGDRPVFILDVSASMLEPIRTPQNRLRGAITGPSGSPGHDRIDWSKVRTKLDLAKAELAVTIEDLPPTTEFGLVFYSDSVSVWKPKLLVATPANKKAAVKRVKGLGGSGNTNIYDAFFLGLELQPDQILFLTDGIANRGTIRLSGAIRHVLKTTYWLRRVRIDCIGVGDHDTKLLAGLAEDCRGTYVSVGR